jgi:hypothetical protein
MQLYTGCPACGKGINADLNHKEACCGPDETRQVAVLQCTECRAQIDVFITIKTKEDQS